MSTEQNKAVLRRWIEAFKPANISKLDQLADELYTADYVLHDPSVPDLPPGPEGVKRFVRGVFKNWRDASLTIDDLVAEGDRVASRFSVSGADASTGKPKCILGMAISRFVGGRIAEEWQLGVPAEAQP